MIRIYVELDNNVPRYACTNCSTCDSLIGKSLCKVKNRGCCWYFPKFTLLDIQRMSKTPDGLKALNRIISNPSTQIYNYYIHAKGFFDESGYKRYMDSGMLIEGDYLEDHTVFFRSCPFVKSGKGCTLPPRFRTFVCNFFLCKEVSEVAKSHELFERYEKERLRYSRWLDWENESLKYHLSQKNITLQENFAEVIKELQDLELSQYEFPYLEPIILDDSWSRGA
ncbi:MAG TPA: hypothetical protein GX498_05345 [Clostridiales bacterium]|nr:hypothetical protein [Clostridiales bacterium]